MATNTNPKTSEHILELDGIRGTAILMVIVWHYFVCQINASNSTVVNWIAERLVFTWSGVDLFLVLSGYLIASILLRNRTADNLFSVFYIRRAARILPLYIALMLSYVIAQAYLTTPAYNQLIQRPMPWWSYATFTQNIYMGLNSRYGAQWLAPTWSLAVEEQFYLLLPALIYVCRPKLLPWLFASAIGTIVLLKTQVILDFRSWVNLITRGEGLFLGALIAWALSDPTTKATLKNWKIAATAAFTGLSAGMICIAQDKTLFKHIDQTWIAMFYGTVLLITLLWKTPLNSVFTRKPLLWLGTISYSLYLVHEPINWLLHGCITGKHPEAQTAQGIVINIASLILSLVIAQASLVFFERPILRWARHFNYEMKAAPNKVAVFRTKQNNNVPNRELVEIA